MGFPTRDLGIFSASGKVPKIALRFHGPRAQFPASSTAFPSLPRPPMANAQLLGGAEGTGVLGVLWSVCGGVQREGEVSSDGEHRVHEVASVCLCVHRGSQTLGCRRFRRCRLAAAAACRSALGPWPLRVTRKQTPNTERKNRGTPGRKEQLWEGIREQAIGNSQANDTCFPAGVQAPTHARRLRWFGNDACRGPLSEQKEMPFTASCVDLNRARAQLTYTHVPVQFNRARARLNCTGTCV